MFKFTEGKEIEELYELWIVGKIVEVVDNSGNKSTIEEVTDVNVCVERYNFPLECNAIHWGETSKLVKNELELIRKCKDLSEKILRDSEKTIKVCRKAHVEANYQKLKEEKVEKKIVRGWEDLQSYMTDRMFSIEKDGVKFAELKYDNVVLQVEEKELGKVVKFLNALGGNFEYKPVEVIDTFEKWEVFQDKLTSYFIIYDRRKKVFIEVKLNNLFYIKEILKDNISICSIEQKYNVDLKILK